MIFILCFKLSSLEAQILGAVCVGEKWEGLRKSGFHLQRNQAKGQISAGPMLLFGWEEAGMNSTILWQPPGFTFTHFLYFYSFNNYPVNILLLKVLICGTFGKGTQENSKSVLLLSVIQTQCDWDKLLLYESMFFQISPFPCPFGNST